jgi:hypothetical protein
MNSKILHQSNENFALRTQFLVVLSIVDNTQNFHDKSVENELEYEIELWINYQKNYWTKQ